MQWFRLYNDVLNDLKVQSLPPDLFKAWINILCLASRHGGVLPQKPDAAFALRMTEEEFQQYVDRLMGQKLLDTGENGNIAPHKWKERQFNSDSSAERMRRLRKRRRKLKLVTSDG